MAGWQGKLKALGTRLDFSAAFRPQTDGRSERTIQTLEDILQMCVMKIFVVNRTYIYH